MADQAVDARPDVEIRSWIRLPGTDLNGRTVRIQHSAACRWCPESMSTPDVRDAVQWADAHEAQQYHRDLKADRIASGIGPRELEG